MATGTRTRRTWWSIPAALLAFVGLPAVLLVMARQRLGSASPLAGMDPPWEWSVEGLRRWARSLGDGLETMDQLVDLFIGLALVAAWVCVAIILWTTIVETIYQLRHGMPSPRRGGPVAWIGRLIATGLIGLLPISATAATSHAALPTRAPVATAAPLGDTVSNPPAVSAPASVTSAGAFHRVAPGESMWSIAEQYASGSADVDQVAARIIDANLGQVMNDGRRFTTAALIEPGWELDIPVDLADHRPVTQVVVESGDSYWRLSEEHLAADGQDPTEHEVLELTKQTMAHNAPRLGYDDPAMLHPGDTIEFVETTAPAEQAETLPPPQAAPLPPPVVSAQPETPPAEVPPVEMPSVEIPPVEMPSVEIPPVEMPSVEIPPVEMPSVEIAPVETRETVEVPATALPAPTTTVALDTTNAQPSDLDIGEPDGDTAAAPIGLAAALMIATGMIAAVESRRRRRLRAGVIHQRLIDQPLDVIATERTLRAASAADLLARLDTALRAVALDLADQQSAVRAAAIDAYGTITLWPTTVALPHGTRWRYVDADGTWELDADVDLVDLAEAARRSEQPCPALVHIGHSRHGQLFVDVEAAGVVSIIDCPDLLNAVAAAIAVPPMGEDVRLLTRGIPLGETLAATPVDSVAEAYRQLAEHRHAVAGTAVGRSTFAMRAARRSCGDTAPVVAVVRADPSETSELGECPSGAGIALITDAALDQAVQISVVDEQTCRLESIGVDFQPVRLSADDLDSIERVLVAADGLLETDPLAEPEIAPSPLDDEVQWGSESIDEPRPVTSRPDAPEQRDAPERFVVRLFGPVTVETTAGEAVAFNRSKAQELVVWMSQHRGRSTRQAARTALWNTDVRDATFSNVVSDARLALARTVAAADGEEWIERTFTEQLPLHAGVVTDSDLMARWRDQARAEPERAGDLLRQALELVRGAPYESSSYLWPDAEGLTSQLIIQATGIATELAEWAMDRGEHDLAFWATAQGLLVLPGHEQLVALRMRAHNQLGNLAGVRHEWESYERALRADVWSDGEPSPMLASLRHQLLSGA